LLVIRQGNVGRIYRLSDQDGGFQKVLTSELDGAPSAWSLDQGAVVVFPQTARLGAWWLDTEGRVRHQESVRWNGQESYYLLGYRILSSEEAWTEIIQHVFSARSSRPMEPLLPSLAAFDLNSASFLLQPQQRTVTLLRRRSSSEIMNFSEYQVKDLNSTLSDSRSSLSSVG
jgi:hypothetical protein